MRDRCSSRWISRGVDSDRLGWHVMGVVRGNWCFVCLLGCACCVCGRGDDVSVNYATHIILSFLCFGDFYT